MTPLPYFLGAVVVAGLAVGVGLACRSKSAGEAPPAPLGQREVASATQSRVSEPRVVVVRDAAGWTDLWQAHEGGLNIPGHAAPVVDFGAEMVVAVFLGERPTGGYAVTITSVTLAEDGLVVAATESAPAPGASVTTALTSPMQAVAVPRAKGEPRLELSRGR